MQEVYRALLELQELDENIDGAERKLAEFAPRMAELDAPVVALERDLEGLRTRLEELRRDVQRLERGANQKRERLKLYEDRMGRIRNQREEAAVRTEMDLVRKAALADEQEALELMEQATRTELKGDDVEKELGRVREDVEPRRQELLAGRKEAEEALEVLRAKRSNQTIRLDPQAARLYERVHAGRSRRVLAALTHDGACGQCFNVLPIQQQAEVRAARSLMRCEACGVILYAEDS